MIVVTGASAGVGRAVVRALARRGASLGLIARGTEGLQAAAKEVEAAGGEALVLPLDVADAAAVDEAARRVEDELGPIDVWINNAMTSVFSPVHETPAGEIRRVTEVTYLGYVHGTLAALRRMRAWDSPRVADKNGSPCRHWNRRACGVRGGGPRRGVTTKCVIPMTQSLHFDAVCCSGSRGEVLMKGGRSTCRRLPSSSWR
ncbi:MAG TPA: SDR family NAD(P)-dependent oxidoreductase, partial [Actinomycetota bacterium]|nr:SDR family NAD(P)-dependent oxidoreductase [Actinomycetota bacterium]